MKSSQLGVADEVRALPPEPAPAAPPADAQTVLEVRNAIGLHARPAARFVETVRRFDADVRVAKAPDGAAGQGDQPHERGRARARGSATRCWSPRRGRRPTTCCWRWRSWPTRGSATGSRARPGPAPRRARLTRPGWPASQRRATGTAPARGRAAGVRRRPRRRPRLGRARRRSGPPSARRHRARRRTAPPTTRTRERERLERRASPPPAPRSSATATTVAARAGKAEAAIFDAHLALLDDEAMLEPAHEAIDAGATAERAWHDAAAAGRRALPRARRAAAAGARGRRARRRPAGGERAHRASRRRRARGATGIVIAGELTPGRRRHARSGARDRDRHRARHRHRARRDPRPRARPAGGRRSRRRDPADRRRARPC